MTVTFHPSHTLNNGLITVGDYDIWNRIDIIDGEEKLELTAKDRNTGETFTNTSTGNLVTLLLKNVGMKVIVAYSSSSDEYDIHVL